MTYIWLEVNHLIDIVEKEYDLANRKLLEYIDKYGYLHPGTKYWTGYHSAIEKIYKELRRLKE